MLDRRYASRSVVLEGQDMKVALPDPLISSVLSQDKVFGAPHEFYRYPARFSPQFVHETIKAFTEPGDLVLDPFCGGGTTLVEALSLGRKAAGMDISSLAAFLTRTKTTPISVHDRAKIIEWLEGIKAEALPHSAIRHQSLSTGNNYGNKNMPIETKVFFGWMMERLSLLPTLRQQAFVRLVLLSVGQWALDCRDDVPSGSELIQEFTGRLISALADYYKFMTETAKTNRIPRCRLHSLRRIVNRSAEGCESDGRIPRSWLPAKLVLTSPPYPGVHMLYHRWQVFGRKETPAPFWLTNQSDGYGASYYTLGGRQEAALKTYFDRLESIFKSVRCLTGSDSLVIQLVAFSDPSWQLPAYLKAMENAGFYDTNIECDEQYVTLGRIWRQVPRRKWYATKKGGIPASKEVLLVHRPVP